MENTKRVSVLPEAEMLEGFPLLHLDCYTVDAGDLGWREWIEKYGHRKTAPGRGIRYQKLMHALEAVYADAGLLVCGIALITPQLNDGRLSLPFPVSQGEWSRNAYRVRFRPGALRRNAIAGFREWLLAEARSDSDRLAGLAGKVRPCSG